MPATLGADRPGLPLQTLTITTPRAPWPALLALLLALAALAIRIQAASQPGLWADEIFSLAIATGHSLEHPAAAADSTLGDFVEPREAARPETFRKYAEQEAHPAGAARVVRAVLLSDTSPPLYYLLLDRWTRAFGTSDAALRLFSVWWAALSLALLWLLGRELGGRRVAWTACLLFSFSPVAIYYSVEGRMYSLLWCLALGLGWLTLRLSAEDVHPWQAALWVVAGAAGLLTHYFFAFVWLACSAWLWLRGSPASRWRLVMLAGVTLLLVLPWYLQVPASLARWRITGGWLNGDLHWPGALRQPFVLAGSLLSGRSYMGGWRWSDRLATGLFVGLGIWMAGHGLLRRMFSARSLLLWGWMAAACAGPLVFDLLRHTTTTEVPRYVLAALPAAMLLAALAIGQLPPRSSVLFLAAMLLLWLPGGQAVNARAPRPWEPYPELGARLDSWARPGDLVLVASIPSGIVGVARYLRRDVPLISWVAQLGGRQVPGDLERLLRGRRRVALARIHDSGASTELDGWLRTHARLLRRDQFHSSRAEVLYFAPLEGDSFFAPNPHPAASHVAP